MSADFYLNHSSPGFPIPASQVVSGVFNPARLGTGSSIATKFLRGDGTWQDAPTPAGVTLGGAFTTAGAHSLTLTTTAVTNVTLPTTGTLSTLAGTETLTNKTLTSPVINIGSDATGDILYRNSGGTLSRLPAGSDGDVLTIAAGVPSYSAPTGGSGGGTSVQMVAAAPIIAADIQDVEGKYNFAATSTHIIYSDSTTGGNVYRWNGSTLSTVAHGGTDVACIGARPGGTLLLGVTSTGTNFRRSGDHGATFANVAPATVAEDWNTIVCGGENGASTVWIVSGSSQTKLQRSTDDGATFADVSITAGSAIVGLVSDGGTSGTSEWLALCSNGTTIKSTDNGATWSAGTSLPDSRTGNGLAYADGLFIALCNNSSTAYYAATTGTAWTAVSLPTALDNEGNNILFLNGKFWLFSTDNDYWWSCPDITVASPQWTKEFHFENTFTDRSDVANMVYFSSNLYIAQNAKFYKIVPSSSGSSGSSNDIGAVADIASSSTTNIGALDAPYVRITGTTTITGFDTIAAGKIVYCRFAAALTLTHNATTLILPSAANITTASGDTAMFVSEGSGNWRCLSYTRASGAPVTGTFFISNGSVL